MLSSVEYTTSPQNGTHQRFPSNARMDKYKKNPYQLQPFLDGLPNRLRSCFMRKTEDNTVQIAS
jgi:hypothetical protein